MEFASDLVGKFVRIEFIDHFRFDKISKRQLALNLRKYSQNVAVGNVLDVTKDFIVLVNVWGESNENLAGMAVFKPSITNLTILGANKPPRH